jgi:hypothetical protein
VRSDPRYGESLVNWLLPPVFYSSPEQAFGPLGVYSDLTSFVDPDILYEALMQAYPTLRSLGMDEKPHGMPERVWDAVQTFFEMHYYAQAHQLSQQKESGVAVSS